MSTTLMERVVNHAAQSPNGAAYGNVCCSFYAVAGRSPTEEEIVMLRPAVQRELRRRSATNAYLRTLR